MSGNQRFVVILAGMFLVGIALMRVSPAQQARPASTAVQPQLAVDGSYIYVLQNGRLNVYVWDAWRNAMENGQAQKPGKLRFFQSRPANTLP